MANKKKKRKSLKTTVFLRTGFSLSIFIIVFFILFQNNISGILTTMEKSYLTQKRDMTEAVVDAALQNLSVMTEDICNWEDTILYVTGQMPDYLEKNWRGGSMLQNYAFNLILIKDAQGNDLYQEFWDFVNERPLDVVDGFSGYISEHAESVLDNYAAAVRSGAADADRAEGAGVMFYEEQPYYICTMPIDLYNQPSTPVGTVTFGYMLDDVFLQNLIDSDDAGYSVEYGQYEGVELTDDNLMSISVPVTDINGETVLIRVLSDRSVYAYGQRSMEIMAALFIICACLFVFAVYFLMTRMILRPMARLSGDMERIARVGCADADQYSKSSEFEDLCGSINSMLALLNQSNISLTVFQSILNGMDAYLYVSDVETDEILFINDKMVEHFGLDEDAVGQTCWKVLQTGMTARCEFCPNHTLKNDPMGTVVWEEHNGVTGRYYRNIDKLIEWSEKQLVHLQHSTDITDIKQAEESLKRRLEQQELMSAITQSFISAQDVKTLIDRALEMAGEFLSASKIQIFKYDMERGALDVAYKWINQEHNLFGYQEESYDFGNGMPLYEAFSVNKLEYIDSSMFKGTEYEAVMDRYGVKALNAVPLYVSGDLWGLISMDIVSREYQWSDSDKQLIQLIASVISGVIYRSETETGLIRMSSIVDQSPQYISYVNTDGKLEYVNQGAVNLSGYSHEELMRGDLSLLFKGVNYEKIINDSLPTVMRQGRQELELPMVRKDGQTRLMAVSAFAINQQNVGIGAIASDITEKRQLERDLVEAKEQAEQSSKAKGDFLSRMSHEMRTPMNAIIGMTHIAKSSDELDKKEYCLSKIEEASNHLLGVINDILDMSKIEANKFELSFTEFSFEKMLMKVINVITFRADEKKQELIINVDKNIPEYIISDEQRLIQVITNLLSNAVKFTPEMGSITLTAAARREQDGGIILNIRVKDTGIGITAEQQTRLFKTFEQADGGISRRYGGTGLGLAISKSIVEMMDGGIWVESEEGQGSTFIFDIRVKKGSQSHRQIRNVDWSRVKILAVDDSEDILEYFKEFALSRNMPCSVAQSGREAIELIQDQAFNVIFVDWMMPGMDGIELTREIKARFGEETVVIMISAAQWSDIEQEAKEAGVDRFVQKPLFPSSLMDCIIECIGMGEERAEQDELTDSHEGLFEGRRILLAEDIEINREIVMAILEPTCVQIDYAENGQEAYDKFKDSPELYDMIFMDIHMPEVDGYQATGMIRALPLEWAGKIPIVAMTANVFREDIERCLEAGMNDHIGKPVDYSEIIEKMRKYLQGDERGYA